MTMLKIDDHETRRCRSPDRRSRPVTASATFGPERIDTVHGVTLERGNVPVSPAPGRLDWANLLFLVFAHAAAGTGIWWAVSRFNPWTLVLACVWLVLCSLSITAGYHRLFAHRTYEAAPWLRLLALLFGAASGQNSALHWVNDHRLHHAKVDRDQDPYNIQRGFLWAHIGWVVHRGGAIELNRVRDLQRDPLAMWQHRHYVPLGVGVGALLPLALAALWGDALGGLLIAGFLRLVCQYHATFATNSLAHTLGSRPYDRSTSARDFFLTALFTFGEGYHNFHHRFQNDYRNGVRAWHFDPTKWLVFALSLVGATRNLRRVSVEKIALARQLASMPGPAPTAPSPAFVIVAESSPPLLENG